MRILHIVHQYPPDYVGGTELYTQSVAAVQSQQGHYVSVFSPVAADDRWPEPVVEDGVYVYRAPAGPRTPGRLFASTYGHNTLLQSMRMVIDEVKPDLVHVQHLMGLPVKIADVLVADGVPYLVTLHDYWHVCANAQLMTNYDRTICAGPRWWLNCAKCAVYRAGYPGARFVTPAIAPIMAWRDRLVGRVLSGASLLISPTNFVRQIHIDMGIPAEKIRVVPHGIRLPDGPLPGREDTDGPLRIAYLGGISWQKGVHILVEAVRQLPVDLVELTIYGDMTRDEAYVGRLRQMATRPGIRFPGRLTRGVLWQTLSAVDLLAVPSIWYETAALVIQEAFAAGLPVVASDLGALRERVIHQRNGLLIPPGDVDAWRECIHSLARDRDRVARLKDGIGRVRSLPEHAQDLEVYYRMIVDGRGP